MSPAQTVKTLLHELAHCRLGHMTSPLSRDAQEVQAESAAFVAANCRGLDTGSYTFDYLANWGMEILNPDNGAKDGAAQFRQVIEAAISMGNGMAEEFKGYLDSFLPAVVDEPQGMRLVA